MLFNVPLTLAPLIVYNLVGIGLFGPGTGDPWTQTVFAVTLVSDGRFTMTLGDIMIVAALFFLFIEIVKATRSASPTIVDHAMSMSVFIVYLVEFIAVLYCATSVFFILMTIALIDVIGGFTITIRTARRDFAYERAE